MKQKFQKDIHLSKNSSGGTYFVITVLFFWVGNSSHALCSMLFCRSPSIIFISFPLPFFAFQFHSSRCLVSSIFIAWTVSVCVCVSMCAYIRMCAYICVCVCVYIYIRTHILCICVSVSFWLFPWYMDL